MKWIPFVLTCLVWIDVAACGDANDADVDGDQPLLTVTVVERVAAPFSSSAAADADTAGSPTTLLFALVGPGGARTESVDFAAHQVKLPQLRQGTWSIRGDGLDADGNVGWSAKTAVFTVTAGKRVPVTLIFEPVD